MTPIPDTHGPEIGKRLAVGRACGSVEDLDEREEIFSPQIVRGLAVGRVSGPVEKLDVREVTREERRAEEVGAAAQSDQRLGASIVPGHADRILLVMTLLALVTLALIVLTARVATEFVSLISTSTAIGWIYLAAVMVVAVSIGRLAFLSWRRYQIKRDITMLRQFIVEHQRTGTSLPGDATRLRQEFEAYINDLERQADAETRESINAVRRKFNDYSGDISRDVEEVETYLLLPFDRLADQVIEKRSAEAAVATAIVSNSLVGVIVMWQAVRLIDQVSQLYAGRPGVWGTLRLLRKGMATAVFAEIAELVAQAVNEAVAQKTLAFLGDRVAEGMANGLLMIRLGQAIKMECRPVPCPRPSSTPLPRLIQAVASYRSKSRVTGNEGS
jgi:uncharacterized membrane protein YcjF (UPF0283 family)